MTIWSPVTITLPGPSPAGQPPDVGYFCSARPLASESRRKFHFVGTKTDSVVTNPRPRTVSLFSSSVAPSPASLLDQYRLSSALPGSYFCQLTQKTWLSLVNTSRSDVTPTIVLALS